MSNSKHEPQTTDTVGTDCPWLGVEVAVAAIEVELHKLWAQDEAHTHASMMNLVVYAERAGALRENSAIIQDLTRDHACRAILVEIDRRSPHASLRAWITAHCHLAGGQKTICCEQIAFYLTGHVPGRFRNTVFAHLNSDLPLVFWWQGELSDILTERLVNAMDRLIVDSADWRDPLASFGQIADAARGNTRLIVQDHAWTRTWQFRLGIASIFDDPVAQQALPDLARIELTYHPGHRISAMLFLAWLAVQAGWQNAPDGQDGFCSAAGNAIRVNLIANPLGPPLAAVTLHAPNLIASLQQGATHVERRVRAHELDVTSLAPADPSGPAELVGLQLARGSKQSLFRKILPRALDLLGRPGLFLG